MNYTAEMDKAMYSAHGVGYEVYSLKHDVRMKIEQKRELDYQMSQQIVANFEHKI